MAGPFDEVLAEPVQTTGLDDYGPFADVLKSSPSKSEPNDLGPFADVIRTPPKEGFGTWLANRTIRSEPVKRVGRTVDLLSNMAKGVVQDVGGVLGGNVQQQTPSTFRSVFPNLSAAAMEQPTPRDIEIAQDKSWLNLPERAVETVAETAPRAAALAAMGGSVPAAAVAFGLGKEGLDPMQAAIGAAFPVAHSIGSAAGSRLASKLGLGTLGTRLLETAGGGAAAQALFDATTLPLYLNPNVSAEEKFQKFVENMAVNLTFSAPNLVRLGVTAHQVSDALKADGRLKPSFADLLQYDLEPARTSNGIQPPNETPFVQNLRTGGTEFAPAEPQPTTPNASQIESPTSVVGSEPAGPAPQVAAGIPNGPEPVTRARIEQPQPEPQPSLGAQASAPPARTGPEAGTPKSPELMTPVEYLYDIHKADTKIDLGKKSYDEIGQQAFDHAGIIQEAMKAGKPVSAVAVEKYELPLEPGYTKQGDEYAIPPSQQQQGTPATQERIVSAPAPEAGTETPPPVPRQVTPPASRRQRRTPLQAQELGPKPAEPIAPNESQSVPASAPVTEAAAAGPVPVVTAEERQRQKVAAVEAPVPQAPVTEQIKQELTTASTSKEASQVKGGILAELNATLADAIPTTPEQRKAIETFKKAAPRTAAESARNKATLDAALAGVPIREFSIPGDGTFKIRMLRENVEDLIKRVNRLETSTKPTGSPRGVHAYDVQLEMLEKHFESGGKFKVPRETFPGFSSWREVAESLRQGIPTGDSAYAKRWQKVMRAAETMATREATETPTASSLLPAGRVEAVTSLRTGRAYEAPGLTLKRRLQLWWHEIAVHGGLQSDIITGQDRIDIDKMVSAADPFLSREADALAQRAGFDDAAQMRRAYGFNESDAGYRWELLARKAEDLADKPKPSWWRDLIGKLQLWLARKFGFRLTESGVEALIRVGAKRMQGIQMEPVSNLRPDGMVDLTFSLKAPSTVKDLEEQMRVDPKMGSTEREQILRSKFISNEVSVGPSEREFSALPDGVRAELPQLANRIAAKDAASGMLRGSAPSRATLRDMATATSPRIEDQTAAMFEGTTSIFELVDSVSDLETKAADTKKEVDRIRKTEATRDQSVPVAAQLITNARQRLTTDREAAEVAGNQPLVEAINRAIGDLQHREAAVAKVLDTVAHGIPPSMLAKSAPGFRSAMISTTTPADIAEWMRLNMGGKFSTETGRLIASTPDIVDQLRVVAGLDEPQAVKDASERLKNQTDALTFMQDKVLSNPEFRTNYKQAVEWSGSAGIRKEMDGNPHYENPYDPSESRTIYPDFDQASWEKNQQAYADVRGWLERYIQDPNADPLKREGYKFALQHMDLLQSQSFAPERGKIAPSAMWNPSYLLIRAIPKFFDVPEHILELIGGRLAYSAYYDLANLSAITERMSNVHNATRRVTQKATWDAGKDAGFTGTPNQIINRWQQDIGNPIFASYQARGDRRLKAGDMVNGHTITKSDMDAVQAQKDYVDGVLDALRSVREGPQSTTQGAFSPIRTLDVVGKTAFEREAQDPSGLTVPQRIRPITRPFVEAWLHPGSDHEKLVNDPSYWNAVLSHVESFSNPDYRSFVDSPFEHEYLELQHEIAATGHRPASLDELAADLFARLGNNINLQTMSLKEIKAQFIDEIDKVVRASETERISHPTLVTDAPTISAISAENFMNRPRGQRLLPKGFYDYTIGTEEQMSGIRTSAKEIYIHRLLKSVNTMRDAMTAKRSEMHQRVQQGLATAATSKKAVHDGAELLHLAEIDRLLPQLNRFISDFKQNIERAKEDERDIYSMVNIARGWLSNSLLQRFGTLWRNAGGGVLNSALMDREMLSRGRNIFYRNWLVQPIYASTKGAVRQGETFVKLASGLLAGTERGKKISAALATNKTVLGNWGGEIAQWIDRQAARVEEMERLGILTPANAGENIAANWDFMQQRGRITQDLETPGKLRKLGRSTVAAMEIAQELGLPLLQLPKKLGSAMVDNAVNATSELQVRDMLDTMHMNAVRAINTRMQFGPIDPRNTVLTPQEVFGLTGKSGPEMERALTALRQEFAKAGVSLDRYLVDYHNAVQRAPGTNPQVLTDAQMNSLRYEMATRMNKGTVKNRPMYNNNATKLMMTFLGYGINQNARLAQFLGSWSRDARKIDPSSFSRAVYIMGALAVLGPLLTYLPTKFFEKLLYNEDKPVKDLWETTGPGDLALTALRQSYGVLPVIGQVLNYTLGSLTGGQQGQFSLLPMSLATAAMNLINKGVRTGEWDRPVMEFIRQWMPNSRIIINRLAMREGITNEVAMRAALSANAPAGVEVKSQPMGGGVRQYSIISGQLDNIVNALSRDGGPDMATVASERQAAINRLVSHGTPADMAAQIVDKAVLDRDPYKMTYGRDPTAAERAKLRENMNTTQTGIMDTVERGRQTYAQAFGRSSPDFTTTRGPAVEAEARAAGLPSPAAGRAAASTGGGGSTSTRSGRISRGGTVRASVPRAGRLGGSLRLSRGTVTPVRSPRLRRSPRIRLARSRVAVARSRHARTR